MEPHERARAERQLGLVTRRQLVDDGATRDHIAHLLATGQLERVRRGVLRVAGTPQSWEQQVLAACFALGITARASHRTAAALWALDGASRELIELTVSPKHRSRQPGLVLHESNVDRPGHRATRGGIPVTSVPRTLADLSALLSPGMLGRVVDDAVRRKLTTMAAYERVARDLATRGRRRSTYTRAVLESRLGEPLGESVAEQRLRRALVGAGLPEPVGQHRISIGTRTVRVDFAYPEHGVVIEYDGWEFHGPRSAFDTDRARGNELELLGLTVLRFTSASTPEEVVRTVASALRTRRSAS